MVFLPIHLPQNNPNVGKYTIHGLHGMRNLTNKFDMLVTCGFRCVFRLQQAAGAWIWFKVFLFSFFLEKLNKCLDDKTTLIEHVDLDLHFVWQIRFEIFFFDG